MATPSHSTEFDVTIIGGGSAGYAAARTAAGVGLKTAVIEGGPQVGGLCILRGCMPTKALLYAAEVMHTTRKAGLFGIHPREVHFDFAEIMARKNRLIGEFADYRREQLESNRFEFIRANAHFTSPHTIDLDSGITVTSKHFVLSTGSVVSPSPLPDLDALGYITSDHALTLEHLPKSLIVLGGGAVAVEFAQFFARFGVQVTLIQRSSHILKEADPEASVVIEKVFRDEGIQLFTETRLLSACRDGELKTIHFEHQGTAKQASAQEILLALGRSPNIGTLNLEAAGVSVDKGRIVVDRAMRTTAHHIYAAGDCTGQHEIVHVAIQQGEIAAHNIAHPEAPKNIDYRLLVNAIFTDPQLAVVGLTEQAAKQQGIAVLKASYPFNDHGKSLIMDAMDGFVSLLADPRTGEILGGCVVGPVGGELIHQIVTAMANRMTVHALAAMPHYHPTLAEIWSYPAEELADQIPNPEKL